MFLLCREGGQRSKKRLMGCGEVPGGMYPGCVRRWKLADEKRTSVGELP